ncbi:MAG TPA: hypothetical protein VGP46_13955 [Acidimicrobiales bacterium]|jgi:hypothetical protein|nr:hypothetical protein [Acidimicrobiales bacterium]
MGIGASLFLIAIGAILDFAVKVQTTGFNINTVGLILLIVGIIGLVLSFVFWSSWGGFGGASRRTSRMTTNGTTTAAPMGRQSTTYVEEEQRI